MKRLRRFLDRIRFFFSWLPIIWRDNQDDYFSFYIIMRHKLKLMDVVFSKASTPSSNITKTAFSIKKCIYILDRLIKDDYSLTKLKNVDDKVFLEVYEKEAFLVEQDKRYLFNILRNHLHTWKE